MSTISSSACSNTTTLKLDNLLPEMLGHTFSFISPLELKNIACVCRVFNKTVNSLQWQKTFQETFGEIKLTREENEIQKQGNLSASKIWQRKYFTFVKKHFKAFPSYLFAISSNEISSLPLKLAHDFHFIKQLQTKKSLPLKYVPADLKKNKEIVLTAVELNGWDLKHAHEDLKKDKEIVLAAVKQNGWALEYADEDLKKDKEIVLAAVKQYGWILLYAHKDLKKDKETVLAAVKQNVWALQCAHKDLKKDKEFVLAAVKQPDRCSNIAKYILASLGAILASGLTYSF
ncbi:MAG: hypothetical protein K1060chlam4_01281, partial [Candidatus Anoxychlamydiales bacterium]|nr:hypothetical protein [Candidatus Anoxychlamydiales bacterium]